MNDCVVDIPVPSFSTLTMQSRDDEMTELFWQPLDQWSFTKPPSCNSADTTPPLPPPSSQPQAGNINNRADNKAAAPRLNYSLERPRPIYPNNNPATSGPPINCFSLQPGRWPVSSIMEGGNLPPLERLMSAGFTVVDSNDTPEAVITEGLVVGPDCPPGSPIMIASIGQGRAVSVSTSSATDSANATTDAAVLGEVGGKVVCQKRKRIDNDEHSLSTTPSNTIDAQTEDLEVESDDGMKNSRGSTATNKRARSAEVHNLSERRRRDRINEKMKALQELIPRCNKLDKASMLDEAIDYLKSLQMQVQMMSSMGSAMMPMIYPGMQQPYMPIPPMSMGTGMGVTTIPPPGIPIPVPSPLSVAGPSVMPPLAPILPPPPLTIPSSPLIDSTGNPYGLPIPGMAQIPNMPADPYQQYMAYQRMQMQMQAIMSQPLPQPALSKTTPSGSGGDNNNDKDVE